MDTADLQDKILPKKTNKTNKNRCYFFRIIWPILLIVSGLTILYIEIPGIQHTPPMMNRLLDDGHFIIFAIISYFVLRLLNIRKSSINEWSTGSYLISFLICSALAIFSESLQIFNARDAEIRDLLFNFLGVFFVLGGLFVYKSTFIRELTKKKRVLIRLFYLIIMLSIFSTLFVKRIRLFYYHHHCKSRLPLIASFENDWERTLLKKNKFTNIHIRNSHATHGTRSLEVICQPYIYPGISIEYTPHDWSKYKTLAFDMYNPQSEKFKLHLRIDAESLNGDSEQRYYTWSAIVPGLNKLRIPISDIKMNNPEMNMNKISRMVLYLYRLRQPLRFYVDNVRLVL